MANRRMIQKSLSVSKTFNAVSEFAQLLYLMITPHLDDFGKVDGDPEVIQALVKPMSKRSLEDFEAAIKELEQAHIIERYAVKEQRVVRYPTFDEDQTGINKRTKSRYPDNPNNSETSENFQEFPRNPLLTKQNRNEDNSTEQNLIQPNRSEDNGEIAGKETSNERDIESTELPTQTPSHGQVWSVARDLHKRMEPQNFQAFNLYLKYAKSIPHQLLYQWASEIEQDNAVRNRGAVFVSKAEKFFSERQAIETKC